MEKLPDDLDRDRKESTLSENAALGIGFAWDLGYIIAIPAVVMGFGGAYADKFLGTKPLLTVLGLFLAFAISAVQVVRKIRQIVGKFPQDLPKDVTKEEKLKSEGEEFHDMLRPTDHK